MLCAAKNIKTEDLIISKEQAIIKIQLFNPITFNFPSFRSKCRSLTGKTIVGIYKFCEFQQKLIAEEERVKIQIEFSFFLLGTYETR